MEALLHKNAIRSYSPTLPKKRVKFTAAIS